jgi:hypothetical protein
MLLSEGINMDGVLVGASLIVIMWIGRMACIRGEYYFTKKFWVVFLFTGIISVVLALFVESLIFSSILSIFGFTFLWGIHEIIEQEERVRKGWFPERKQKRKDG